MGYSKPINSWSIGFQTVSPDINISGGGTPAGFVSPQIYETSGSLEAAYPAASNSGSFGLVTDLRLNMPSVYVSDGTNWTTMLLTGAPPGGGRPGSTL